MPPPPYHSRILYQRFKGHIAKLPTLGDVCYSWVQLDPDHKLCSHPELQSILNEACNKYLADLGLIQVSGTKQCAINSKYRYTMYMYLQNICMYTYVAAVTCNVNRCPHKASI